MLTVHHLGVSQSERIVWLCEELEIPYELKLYQRRADNRLAPDDYKALHPMGIAPVITDGDLVLGESGAICEYICALPMSRLRRDGSSSPLAPAASGQGRAGVEETIGGRLTPAPTDPDFADHLFWFHWSNATFMATLMMQLVLSAGVPTSRSGRGGTDSPLATAASGQGRAGVETEPENFARPFVEDRARRAWAMIEARLAEAPFFGGANLTTADIMMVYGLTTSRMFRGQSIDPYPNLKAYLARIGQRPAYRRAMAKAEPGVAPKLD